MLRQALAYSKKNEAYCRQYGLGRNSVLNRLLQVGLHRMLGHASTALRVATEAERLALESQNFPDAMKAHRHRIAVLLEGGQARAAKETSDATVKALGSPRLRRMFAGIYANESSRLRED